MVLELQVEMLRSTVAAKSLWHVARRLPRAAATCRLPSTSSARIHVRNYAAAASKPAERFEFQAETKNLLDIVAKSLYSDQEVTVASIYCYHRSEQRLLFLKVLIERLVMTL